MIATAVASPLLTPFKLTFFVALFIAMPVVLYQVWAFVAPGLYKREKRFAFPLLASSILLFYAGVAFAFYVVFPLVFGFFTAITPDGVEMMTDISAYLDFITTIVLIAFGIAFEVPIATVLVVWTGPHDTREARQGPAVCIPDGVCIRHAADTARCHQPDLAGGTRLPPLRARDHYVAHVCEETRRARSRSQSSSQLHLKWCLMPSPS